MVLVRHQISHTNFRGYQIQTILPIQVGMPTLVCRQISHSTPLDEKKNRSYLAVLHHRMGHAIMHPIRLVQ